MKRTKFNRNMTPYQKRYFLVPLPRALPKLVSRGLGLLSLVIVSNVLSHKLWNPKAFSGNIQHAAVQHASPKESLYLINKAALHISEITLFEDKVRDIASMLDIPPEWLMAVMYAESKFDASVLNFKGSGAVGLIQFMPTTAMDMNVSVERLKRMTPLQQLEYVYLYLQKVRERYGDYQDLSDLYLAILYPKARNQDYCFTLYAKPEKAYLQNQGLDENGDGRVSISDIDRRMQRIFPSAYQVSKNR